jgi:oxygen-independent coproporphyrinogen-3 oxidase
MREGAVKLLKKNGYKEHPTMYFYHPDKKPEKWKSLTVDQDKQFAEIGFGMGGSSSCMKAESINATSANLYFEKLRQGQLPIESARGFSNQAVMKKSVQMALSSCQPLKNALFKKCFPGHSLFTGNWKELFNHLEKRKLIEMDHPNQSIQLTPAGLTLVEAIIHCELS